MWSVKNITRPEAQVKYNLIQVGQDAGSNCGVVPGAFRRCLRLPGSQVGWGAFEDLLLPGPNVSIADEVSADFSILGLSCI